MIFKWILKNKLAIGTPPISVSDQSFLLKNNVNSIIDLRNNFDFSRINYLEQKKYYERFNYINLPLPDHNSKRIATNDEIEHVLTNLVNYLKKGIVFIHCHAAVERSPLICIAFLVKFRELSLTEAYEYVKQQNEPTNVLLTQLSKI